MDRKKYIQRYLDAEMTPAEERELALSFKECPPIDKEEAAVDSLLRAIRPVDTQPLPEAEGDFDGILSRMKRRTVRTWGLSLAAVAAAVAVLILFTGRPSVPAAPQQNDALELVEQLTRISTSLNPSNAENIEFRRVGDGFVMTAYFADGQTASYLLAPIDGGNSFDLIALKQ